MTHKKHGMDLLLTGATHGKSYMHSTIHNWVDERISVICYALYNTQLRKWLDISDMVTSFGGYSRARTEANRISCHMPWTITILCHFPILSEPLYCTVLLLCHIALDHFFSCEYSTEHVWMDDTQGTLTFLLQPHLMPIYHEACRHCKETGIQKLKMKDIPTMPDWDEVYLHAGWDVLLTQNAISDQI